MKKNGFYIGVYLYLLFLLFGAVGARGQGCYVQLDDASGFDVSSYLPGLEEQACKITEPFFDSTYADSFKVYSFGFYKDLKIYDGYSYPDAFVDVQNKVSQLSPYYLLIGKQTDHTGVYTDFFVDVKLPDGGHFPCITPDKSEVASDYVKYAIKSNYAENSNSPYLYAEAEKAGMEEFQAFIDKSVNCCTSQKNLCECKDEEEKNANLLKGKGFLEQTPSSGITFYPAGYSDELESDFEISITNDMGMSFQLTAETDDFLNLSGINGSVKVHYFDELPENCEGFDEFLSSLNLRYGAGSAGLDYVEDIVLFNFNGKARLFYKFSTPSTGPPALNKPGIEGNEKILPWLAAWVMRKAAAAGAGVILHVGINVALEKWINDYSTWGEAWDNVDIDPYDLIVAGVDGAMGLNSILGQAAFDGITAGIQYLLNTDTDQITFMGFFSIVEGDFIQSLKYGAIFGLVGAIAEQALKIGKKYFPIIKNHTDEFIELFISFAKDGKVMGKNRIRAWSGLINRPKWVKENVDLLEKLKQKSDDYIAKVDELYSPTVMKLPPNLKPPNNPPGSYDGIIYDKFGFPKLEPHVSDYSHVVKIAMDGSNDDYIKAYNELKKIIGEGNIQFTNQYGSSFKIKQNGQWSAPYTWHHHQDGETMMPVLQTIHQSIQNYHTGGRAVANRGLIGLFDPPQL